MRLRHLQLQGYKTFAFPTEFLFDGGITAIVGPNGSGKSNIADAIRWVLGEQSYRALRGKRTEDMIFTGSAQRARSGMAAVSLVLDNADGWLPIDFSEVTVTRRAYRSGENEYLLNGSRVRLRDINELLAKSGLARRSYTVIGQGLVDAVLSLRAEDRRALFEEASGISLYQSKRSEAMSRLDETRSNLLRVNDIVNEIAPRLRRLERDAERAERHALLSAQLDGLLRTWYGFRWRQEQLGLRRAQDAVARRQAKLDRYQRALAALDGQMAKLRQRQARLREDLGDWHRESSQLHGQMEELQRELAVWQERSRQLGRQRDELQAELTDLKTQERVAAGRVVDAEASVQESLAALTRQEELVLQRQNDLDVHEGQRAELSRQLGEARARVLKLTTQTSDLRNRLVQFDERRAALTSERDEHLAEISSLRERDEELYNQLDGVVSEEKDLRTKDAALAATASRLEASIAEVQARQSEVFRAVTDSQRQLERLQGRYDLLTRLRDEGEGLHVGVRSVLRAASKQRSRKDGGASGSDGTALAGEPAVSLAGVVGTVAQLIRVPSKYEVAIEVALGGHVQDVVVESWADAETAISYLRAGKKGRATFLPLDTVRQPKRLDLPRERGLEGVGADLVRAEERLAPVIEMLLGRTVVARDLPAARRIFGRLRGGFQIVTLAGEVLRSSGSVTGGDSRKVVHGQVLAREREWRRLPDQIGSAQGVVHQYEEELAGLQSSAEEMQSELAALAAERRQLEESLAAAGSRRRDLEREAEHLAQQIDWRRSLVARLDGEEEELAAQESDLQTTLGRLALERKTTDGEVSAVQDELDQLQGEVLYQRLSEARTEAAVARGTWDHRRAALEGLTDRKRQIHSQFLAKRQRVDELEAERVSLNSRIEAQAAQEAVIRGGLDSLLERIDAAETEVAAVEAEREKLDLEDTTVRARLRDAESRHSQSLLVQSRQEDRLQRLREQIEDDFGLVDMEPTEGLPEQPPLPLGTLVSTLTAVDKLPEGLEDEIRQIRAQLKRMGSVNPNAPDEYAEVLDRYSFLTSQASDLEEAVSGLRQVIVELEEVMRLEFEAMFKEVAQRFKENFVQLFGGGAARLLLTEPDDISRTGVEIIAQPPGRRRQTLALLSGGERSLTAVALIFALLQVSAPPFCVLDEVDAMLDEANVRRFRAALEDLAQRTQFIVITHNRRTIEAADTIYGISMGDDSVSQAVSLRLEGDRIAAPDGSTVDVAKDG